LNVSSSANTDTGLNAVIAIAAAAVMLSALLQFLILNSSFDFLLSAKSPYQHKKPTGVVQPALASY
jgi:hypothetical protein